MMMKELLEFSALLVNMAENQPRDDHGRFSSSHTKASKEFKQELEYLHSSFPKLKTLPTLTVEIHEGATVTRPPNTLIHDPTQENYALYSHGKNKLDIASTMPERAEAKLGGPTVGQDYATAFRHEFGHHTQDNLERPIDPLTGKKLSWQNIANKFIGNDKPTLVSEYAKLNHKELFAESFAVYTGREYKRGSLPKEIENYLDLILKVI